MTVKWSELCARHRPTLTTAPTVEPVSVDEFREHVRFDSQDEDGRIRDYLAAARQMVEDDTQRALITQTWALRLDEFPCDVIELRRCPVTAVTSITYTDTAGATQTWSSANYVVDIYQEPARITLAYGQTWPATYDQANAVTVTFTAGYGSAGSSVRETAKQAIRLLAGHWFTNRETADAKNIGAVAYAYDALIDRLRWAGYR